MRDVYWKSVFPQAYQKVRQIPLARNLPPAQWMFLSLENSLIQSAEYLAWASPFYGLATLKNTFFAEQFTPSTYEKYKDHFHWGPQALPVFEWDGVLFVACVDPHSVPTHLDFVCRPLLASYEDLLQGWAMITNPQNSTEPVITAEPGNHLTEAPLNEPPSSLHEAPMTNDEPPVLTAEVPPPAPAEEPSTLMNELPVFSEIAAPNAAPSPTGGGNLFELEDSAPDRSEGDSELSGENVESESVFEMPEGLNLSMEPAPEAPASQPMFTETPLKAIPQSPPPPAPAKASAGSMSPPPKPVTTHQPPLTKREFSQPPPEMELEEELKLSFAKAYQSYRNLMVLKMSDSVVIPFRWDQSYKNPKSLEPIELNRPSIFRIAAKTHKPFHGAISPNEINQHFFENWFGGHIPTYVTIVPLFFERDCVGLLLGAADEELDRKDSLHLMETTAQKVEANFGARLAS